MNAAPEIRPHPRGGYTIAVPVPGTLTAKIYVGNWTTRRQATIALDGARPMFDRSLRLAAALAEIPTVLEPAMEGAP